MDAQLTLEVAARGATLDVSLCNRGVEPLPVLVCLATSTGRQYDRFTVVLTSVRGHERSLRFFRSSNPTRRVVETLAPGDRLTFELDLDHWSRRPANPGGPLPAGRYWAQVRYEVTEPGAWWTGSLAAGPIDVDVP